MQANQSPLNTLEALYVAGSRHTDNLAIITDDKNRLMKIITEKLDVAKEQIRFTEPEQKQLVDTNTILAQDRNQEEQEIVRVDRIDRETERGDWGR